MIVSGEMNVRTANGYLKKVLSDSELEEDSVIRKLRITACNEEASEG